MQDTTVSTIVEYVARKTLIRFMKSECTVVRFSSKVKPTMRLQSTMTVIEHATGTQLAPIGPQRKVVPTGRCRMSLIRRNNDLIEAFNLKIVEG